jgi:rare lipoprotein A
LAQFFHVNSVMHGNRPARSGGNQHWVASVRGRVLLVIAAVCLACGSATTRAPAASHPLTQIGLASYYGPGLHGERTASGERFDQNELVAAHRTLPFGTLLRVTNLENGREVHVRIIDRGPSAKYRARGRIIDLSRAAARRLRFLDDGVVRVRLEVVRYGPRPQ